MKRRDLIKNSILATGLSIIGNNSAETKQINENLNIIPQQTGTYNISMPMPFSFKNIDDIVNFNKRFLKSKITTLYNSLTWPLVKPFGGEFQRFRGYNEDIKTFDDFAKYVKYTKESGLNFVYTLNSPKPFTEPTYKKYKKVLFELLDNLQQIGCYDLKIANQQLMEVINRENFKFNFHVSTSCEYHNIQQYENLIHFYPNIKSINLPTDDNRNFKLLKNLKKKFPDVDLEILVNEPCMSGCPSRNIHACVNYLCIDCFAMAKNDEKINYFFKANMIYPWQLEYYSAIGINFFKFALPQRGKNQDYHQVRNYIYCVENGIEDVNTKMFFYDVMWLFGEQNIKDIKMKEIQPYFPDIRHFVKNGDKCSTICGVECNYCMDCAEKIKKIIL